MNDARAVMVTTRHRGVFFGYVNGAEPTEEQATLDRARMCVYWSSDVRGVLGLVSGGPTGGCRVTHALAEPMTIYGITGVFDVTADAVKAWERGPWS